MQNKSKHLPELRIQYVDGTAPKVKITGSSSAYDLLKGLYDPHTLAYRESAYALYLDRQNRTLGWLLLSLGGTYSTVIDAKLLFTTALSCGASGIILSHNHPSGSLYPSEQDKKLTSRFVEIGVLLGIPIVDHLILTVDSYYSFTDNYLL